MFLRGPVGADEEGEGVKGMDGKRRKKKKTTTVTTKATNRGAW